MSHIPNNAVPHAKPHDHDGGPKSHGADPKVGAPAGANGKAAPSVVERVTDSVKSHPAAAIGIGAAVVAGIAAAVAAPALAKGKGSAKKPKAGKSKAHDSKTK